MSLILSSCTLSQLEGHYGLVSNEELEPGESLVLSDRVVRNEECLTMILGIIPVGNFKLQEFTERVDKIIEENNAKALGNVKMDQSFFMFLPFYTQVCSEIQGSPLKSKAD